MESRNVFISCTTKDLAEYRREAVNVMAVLNEEYKGKFQLVDMTMDNLGQSGKQETAVDVSTDWVKKADWIVLIVAWNYGHVQEGHVRSVTESEYRFSQEQCTPPKVCFVFLAGEKTDGKKRYERKKPEREQNLVEWDRPPDEHEEDVWRMNRIRLQSFKNDLRTRHVELFSDIEDFSNVLRNTLSTKIKSELKLDRMDEIVQDHTLLITLILSQKKPIQDFITEIKQLAKFKRIHERLHHIRQLGTRRWREEVLNLWQQGVIDGDSKEVFLEVRDGISQQRGALEILKIDLPLDPSNRLGEQIQTVLEFELPVGREIVTMAKGEFERIVDGFARSVQRAFSAADTAMRGRKDPLRKQFTVLIRAFSNARKSQALTHQQDRLLDEGLDQVEQGLDEMEVVLERHCRWQNVHNALEDLDLCAKADFRDELDVFLKKSNCVEICTLLDEVETALGCIDTAFLKKNIDAIKALVCVEPDQLGDRAATAYASMRKAYDDIFFKLDEATLAFIDQSDKRAKIYEGMLKKLEDEVRHRDGNG